MEPKITIETMAMLRVVVLPIGEIPTQLLRDYTAMIISNHTVSLSSVSSFYTEHQKSPFSHQPWDSPAGSLHFKFLLGGTPPSPWENFQSNRKVLAVIGFYHCPSSPDLDDVIRQFSSACRGYSSALVQRCFAFCPSDSQLEDGSKEDPNLKLFPPTNRLRRIYQGGQGPRSLGSEYTGRTRQDRGRNTQDGARDRSEHGNIRSGLRQSISKDDKSG